MKYQNFIWCDRRNRIVVRGRRAIALSMLEFAIFDLLHKERTKMRISRELVDEVYAGSVPPLMAQQSAYLTARKLNSKLKHLDLKIKSVNRRHNSFYRLLDISLCAQS